MTSRSALLTLLYLSPFCLFAMAQNPETACFPNCTEADFLIAENSVKTELSENLDLTETTITVADASRIRINQPCFAEDGTGELMHVTGKPGGNDITVERAFDRTSAANHSTGAVFRCGNAAKMFNQSTADLLRHQAEILLCTSTSELTISGGSITVPYSGCFSVDTEADAPSDDLTAIVCAAGVRIRLFPESASRTVVVKTPVASRADYPMDDAADSWDGWCRQTDTPIETNRSIGG